MKKTLLMILPFLLLCSNPAFSQLKENMKMYQVLNLINDNYVEKPDMPKLVEKAIVPMLAELDPHSMYISAKDVQKANEALNGNFDGIGVSFQIMKDSIHVVDVIRGGPSEKVGIQAGDIIVKVDGKVATGDTITNNFVYKNLRGKKGTVAKVDIRRRGKKETLHFDITRDKIPINSIDTYFMIDKKTGYIRLDRFSRTTMEEFRKSITDLKDQGMTQLVFDLRGNGGGYLDVAVALADEFLPEDKLIVYTQGISSPYRAFNSTKGGSFEKGRLVILIDEYSASASEIVSGAIQDWDRGLVIGRRSFGKGLVQRVFQLNDGAQMRLTTARYYTPSGRCIQKPYKDGLEAYYKDLANRYSHKEMINPDSISLPDSVKFYTSQKRVVYGGGGIIPDFFIPVDTTRMSDYWINLNSKGLINRFALEWTEKHRSDVLSKYPDYSNFAEAYSSFGIEEEFAQYAEKQGVEKTKIRGEWARSWIVDYLNKAIKDTVNPISEDNYHDYVVKLLNNPELQKTVLEKAGKEDEDAKKSAQKSEIYINTYVKALIARNLYGFRYYYEAYKEADEGYKTAVDIIGDTRLFKKNRIAY